jgi:hypothetical protein
VACVPDPTVAGRPTHHAPEYFGAAAERLADPAVYSKPSGTPSPQPLATRRSMALVSFPPETRVFSLGACVLVSFRLWRGMLRTRLDEIVGRLRQLASHADSREDENHRLQTEQLAILLAARRDNDETVGRHPRRRHRLGAEPVHGTGGVQSERLKQSLIHECCASST